MSEARDGFNDDRSSSIVQAQVQEVDDTGGSKDLTDSDGGHARPSTPGGRSTPVAVADPSDSDDGLSDSDESQGNRPKNANADPGSESTQLGGKEEEKAEKGHKVTGSKTEPGRKTSTDKWISRTASAESVFGRKGSATEEDGVTSFAIVDEGRKMGRVASQELDRQHTQRRNPQHEWLLEVVGEQLCLMREGAATVATVNLFDAITPAMRLVLVLLAARWCPLCNAFGEKLKVIFDEIKLLPNARSCELIWVSFDVCEDAYSSYLGMLGSNISAVPFNSHHSEKIPLRFEVHGVPSLLVLDALSGQTVTNRGRDDVIAFSPPEVAIDVEEVDASDDMPKERRPSIQNAEPKRAASKGIPSLAARVMPIPSSSKMHDRGPKALLNHWDKLLEAKRNEWGLSNSKK